MREPEWLSPAQIARLNEILVGITGEPHLVLNPSALDGAAHRPRNLWHYEGVFDHIILAVRLLEGIGQGHCFQQGNKRTAWNAALAFLRLNGTFVFLPDTVELAKLVEGVIIRRVEAGDLIAALRAGLPRSMPQSQ